MTPGAVAAVLYSRCRRSLYGFHLESEPTSQDGCFIVTASWVARYGSDSRTYSSILAIGVPDLAKLFQHILARAGLPGMSRRIAN